MTFVKVLTNTPVYVDFPLEDNTAYTMEAYRKRQGYVAWDVVQKQFKPDEVVQIVKNANVWGRGGAGFPAGMKWTFLPKNSNKPIYLCVNADEGEPGTFKDRMIMERNPHQLVEGVLISSYAIGSKHAFIYIRGELFLAYERVCEAVHEARQQGLLKDIEITVYKGAGAYICGEETAMINSLEGKKGYPRNKPPFPAIAGLYNCPTIVNNVQTMATIPWILRNGSDGYLKIGNTKSIGTHLFGVSGHVKRPGLYEVAMGYPLKKLIYEDCGGILGDRKLKALIPGGSSVHILRGEDIENVNLDPDSIKTAGSMLGTGAIIVMAEGTCIVRALWVLLRFYAHESCGQCTPCREGLGILRNIVHRIENGKGTMADLDELIRLVNGIEGNTVCMLADAACWPTRSYLAKFRQEFIDHIQQGRCPYEQKFPILNNL